MIKDMLKRAAPGVIVACIAGFSGSAFGQGAVPRVASPPAAQGVPSSFEAAPTSFSFTAVKVPGGAMSVSGQVPSEATLRYLTNQSGVVVDRLAVSPNAPADFGAKLQAGLRALMELDQGRLELVDGTWKLTGEASTADVEKRVVGSLGRGFEASVDVVLSLNACRERLAELSAHNAILFRSGSAIIAEQASAELDLFAQTLSNCGAASIEVEGHTDSDGDDRQNLVLSVMRAEAVVKALVARGVDEDRFYAIGYGESQPIAANDTPAGKAANRRIVIKLRD